MESLGSILDNIGGNLWRSCWRIYQENFWRVLGKIVLEIYREKFQKEFSHNFLGETPEEFMETFWRNPCMNLKHEKLLEEFQEKYEG